MSREKNFCLVTGAGGFLGSHLCSYLIDKGNMVIGVSRKEGFLSPEVLDHPNFFFIKGDMMDISSVNLAQINNPIDVIFHLASQQPSSAGIGYEDFYRGNVMTTQKVIEWAQEMGVGMIVYTSTIAVFGDRRGIVDEETCVSPNTYYAITKYVGERLLYMFTKERSGARVVIFRLPSVFGKNHLGGIVHTISSLAKENKTIELFSKGQIKKPLISYKTVLDSLYTAWMRGDSLPDFEVFLLADYPTLVLKEVAEVIVESMGSDSRILLSERQSVARGDMVPDTTKARTLLGLEGRDVREALRDYVREVWL